MKFFACLFALAAIATIVLADKNTDKKEGIVGSSYGAPAPSYQASATYSAPPCAQNYLFSCQPNLAPVPCAAGGSGGYGSAGAYSEYAPQYAYPQYAYPQY